MYSKNLEFSSFLKVELLEHISYENYSHQSLRNLRHTNKVA